MQKPISCSEVPLLWIAGCQGNVQRLCQCLLVLCSPYSLGTHTGTARAPGTTGAQGDLTTGDGLMPWTSADKMPFCCSFRKRIRFALIFEFLLIWTEKSMLLDKICCLLLVPQTIQRQKVIFPRQTFMEIQLPWLQNRWWKPLGQKVSCSGLAGIPLYFLMVPQVTMWVLLFPLTVFSAI